VRVGSKSQTLIAKKQVSIHISKRNDKEVTDISQSERPVLVTTSHLQQIEPMLTLADR
jgi:hypothetical protein